MPKLVIGEVTHCKEIGSGRDLTGNLIISKDEMKVDLYCYDDFFYIRSENPIFLLTRSGHVVSFHSNVDSSHGTAHCYENSVHHQAIISNLAIVGPNKWDESDKIKSVSFRIDHTIELLRNKRKISRIRRGRGAPEDAFKIFECVTNDKILRAWYAASYSLDSDGPKSIWPSFTIDFDEPKDIHDFIVDVSTYVYFFSLCLGVQLKPRDIKINRLSSAEIMEEANSNSYQGPHDVHYVWPEMKIDASQIWAGGSPVIAWTDKELETLQNCLIYWMNRADAWTKSYSMMITSLGLANEISPERLLSACRWFEEIPLTKNEAVLSDAQINAIAGAASGKAKELGYQVDISGRVKGAVKQIKTESSADRFTRLITLVRKRFGDEVLPSNVISHLNNAVAFRGRTAHGHFNPSDRSEFLKFSKATRAMEALCHLLTAIELPMNKNGLKRIKSNPVIQSYDRAYE